MYNVTEKQSDVQVVHAQVIYLKEVLNWSASQIAELTGYAVSTVKNYFRKYADLLEWAKQIFEKVDVVVRKSKYNNMIDSNGFNIDETRGELCYLFEFYDKDGNLLCSKVGTTTRTIRKRLREELASKTYRGMGAEKAIVRRIYECGELPAEGLESLIRSEYIKRYPKSFKKNDRFIGTLFDFNVCDSVAKNYLTL